MKSLDIYKSHILYLKYIISRRIQWITIIWLDFYLRSFSAG